MARFFNRKPKSPKKTKEQLLKEQAEEIVASIENADIESPDLLGKQALEMAQDVMTNGAEANEIKELPLDDKKDTVKLINYMIQNIVKSENVSTEVAETILISLIQDYSKKIGVATAEKVAEILPDEVVENIINTPEVGISDAQRIVTGIDDDETREKIQEELDLAKLKDIYENCGELSDDDDFVNNILKIKSSYSKENEEINKMIEKIIAKRSAYYFYKFGGILIYKYTKLMTPLQMLECNLVDLIEKEYKQLDISNEKTAEENLDGVSKNKEWKSKKRPFNDQNRNDIQSLIISRLAEELADSYLNQNSGSRAIKIPESEAIRNFSEEEEETLVNELKNFCKNKKLPLKDYQIQDIRYQIRGFSKTEEVEILKSELDSIRNPELRRMFASNLEQILKKVQELSSEEDQTKTMEVVVTATDQVTKKVEELNAKRNTFDGKDDLKEEEPNR